MSFVPIDLKQKAIEENKLSKSKWKSMEGWIYPQVKTTLECNEHPKKPDQATIEKLNEVKIDRFFLIYFRIYKTKIYFCYLF